MSKTAGMGDQLLVAQYDLSGDTGSLGRIGGGNSPLEVTGINKSAFERLGGLRDGGIDWTSWFNPGLLAEHVALSPLPTTNTLVSYFRGTTLGNPAASMTAKQVNYDPTRGTDGSLTFGINAVANGFGLEWGHNLTGSATTVVHASTGAEDLDGFDDGAGAATDFGLQAYLHVTEFTGTDATIALEDSDDDAATDPYAAITGAAFTQVTTETFERIATGATENVKEWIRVAITGTFDTMSLAVVVVRNLAAPAF